MALALINKNLTKEEAHDYLFTSMVSHRGVPVSFAMRDDGRIFYSVLDMSNTKQNAGSADDNDKNYWSKVSFDAGSTSELVFPNEIMQVGYGLVPNVKIEKYDCNDVKVVHGYDNKGNPLDGSNNKLTELAIQERADPFYSSTARLGAAAPFQALSDGQYVYIFRQSIPAPPNDSSNESIVNSSLLVDRFILSGTTLKLSREVRYQRSRHKTEPESRKDSLAAIDVEGYPFYEPTRELAFANNLSPQGGFTVLLIPGADSEEQRWQIFTTTVGSEKVNSFNIRFDSSIVFDTSDSEVEVDAFLEKYALDRGFVAEVQDRISQGNDNASIVKSYLSQTPFVELDYAARVSAEDALAETIYTIQTGVSKDDFVLGATSNWPLIEYDHTGQHILPGYLNDKGVLEDKYSFIHGDNRDLLNAGFDSFSPEHGLSSCYYYQQEMGPDNKPMKNNACVMLALGLKDKQDGKYIGILNFTVAASGRLSRLTVDQINLPDINIQALDENPYQNLEDIPTSDENRVAWQKPQKMNLLDIDPNGLSTSGGVLRFAYTTSEFGVSAGYSDAVEATDPYVFDDSLGRVNLYLKGKNNNFFVLYFNPTGSKNSEVTHNGQISPLTLKPRLDRDMTISVTAEVAAQTNSRTLKMSSSSGTVETWAHLPRRFSQIADLLNGNGELTLGTLEPLGNSSDPRAAYLKQEGVLKLRTGADNDLMFQATSTFAVDIADGKIHQLTALSALSDCLAYNSSIKVAQKTFTLKGKASIQADLFHKPYLSGLVSETTDVSKLWTHLTNQKLIQESPGKPDQAALRVAALSEGVAHILTDEGIKSLNLELLAEGAEADKNARRARLRQALIALIEDVANVRLATFEVQDTNPQAVDRLDAGLPVQFVYDYSNFACHPEMLDGASASEWGHARSYLFDAALKYDDQTDASTEINSTFNDRYVINNTVGQWEDWEASLAVEFTPQEKTNGAVFHAASDKLEVLRPTRAGLSVEGWVKPSNGKEGNVVYYRKGTDRYSLSVISNTDGYKCVTTLGDKKYTSKKTFAYDGQWRHLAFTHKKYWGYKLGMMDTISCGNDNSLQLIDDFSLEVLVKVDTAGRLLNKQGEYCLSIIKISDTEYKVDFQMAGADCLSEEIIPSIWLKPHNLASLGNFLKITLIRSKSKPQAEPLATDYPMTGAGNSATSGDKWYKNKSSEELIQGMAEKQDQLQSQMAFSQQNLFGTQGSPANTHKPKYYYNLIVRDNSGSIIDWATNTPKEAVFSNAHSALIMGGGGFVGNFASVRIWNRALSKSEAMMLSMPENKTGLLSHWRISEGKGKYLYDEVSENHGVASGGQWVDSPQTHQAGQFQIYVDGFPEDHDTSEYPLSGVDQLSIGGKQMGDNSYVDCFAGALEEIRIWGVPRTNEQITDNAFGRLKGEWEQLLANYTFDTPRRYTDNQVQDASVNSIQLSVHNPGMLKEVLSTAPISTEIPQVRSALTGVRTPFNETIQSRPAIVEYGDVQKNDDGTLNGILKRCYSFIDTDKKWHRMTGFKVGNLISQWYGQAQFAPQVMGFLEGAPPLPGENFLSDLGGSDFENSVSFNQAEEISYNYSTSKEAGWNVAVESEGGTGMDINTLLAPLGFGISFKADVTQEAKSNWETSGKRSQSYERGTSVNTERSFSATQAGYDDGAGYYRLGNTGFALVKSKTADIYLLRLAHNNALVSISWQPNPDIPEDVNILPFPINPLYTKQGTLDGKFGQATDKHYPQAHGAYGQYSYFKPREAYALKKQIERETLGLKAYFEDVFDPSRTNAHFQAAAATTGVAQLAAFYPAAGPLLTSAINQVAGQIATQVAYNNTGLKSDLARMGSQRNLVNTYVWTIEGGFYTESTEVAETQQETYAGETSLALGGAMGVGYKLESGAAFEQKTFASSGSSFTLTKSKTQASSSSFGLDVSVGLPTTPRYKYAGVDGRTLTKGLIPAGTVDAYRFMSFYLEPKGQNFMDLFGKVIDPIWLDESPDPSAQALRQARGNIDRAKPCWRIMHRVTYVSRVLPEFQPEAPPSLEKSMRATGIESNYMLIKKFEPYLKNISDPGKFSAKIEDVINNQLAEFRPYKAQITRYLMLYFNIE